MATRKTHLTYADRISGIVIELLGQYMYSSRNITSSTRDAFKAKLEVSFGYDRYNLIIHLDKSLKEFNVKVTNPKTRRIIAENTIKTDEPFANNVMLNEVATKSVEYFHNIVR